MRNARLTAIRRGTLRLILVAALLVGFAALGPATAQAGPYRADCHAWTHSTSAFTSGVSATCNGGPIYVQYRVVGLCINKYTWSSRWVYGWWMNTGISH